MIFTLVVIVLLVGSYSLGYWMGVESRKAKIVELDDFSKKPPTEYREVKVVDLRDPLDIDLN